MVVGSHMWREIAFGVPNPHLILVGYSNTNGQFVKVKLIVGVGTIGLMVSGF